MTTNDAERVLELEESAEGVELFRPPGEVLLVEKARDQAEASGWIPEREGPAGPGRDRLEAVREYRDALGAAMHSLETTVARPASAPAWSAALDASLTRLRAAVEAHVRTVEGPDGLLEEILGIAPRLAHETTAMETEHVAILRTLARAEDALNRGAGARDVRRAVMALLGSLAAHRQRGSDLVYEAYSVDLGRGD